METFFSVPQDGGAESCDGLYKHSPSQRGGELLELGDNSGTGANGHKASGESSGLEIKRLPITKRNSPFKRDRKRHGSVVGKKAT